MTTTEFYKVLWVDDEETIVNSTQTIAEGYNLQLVHFTNWEEAEKSLRHDFDDYSAIILDANCKTRKDSVEQEEFITAILPSLTSIFGEKRRLLPWYILSAGTMSNFNNIINGADYQHSQHKEEWGEMLYLKDAVDGDPKCSSKLFQNIQRIAKEQVINIIIYRHSDIFCYLGHDKLIDSRARKLMIKMLSALYYPEENIKYEYEGNPLRKVVEYIFRAANKVGLLPDECLKNRGKEEVNLLDSNRFLSGQNPVYCSSRYGKAGNGKYGQGGDSIFTKEIGEMMLQILNYANPESHTKEDDPYTIEEDNSPYSIGEDKKDMFFGYLLHLCQVIKFFGKFVEKHNSRDENTKMFMSNPDYNNQTEKSKKQSYKTNTTKQNIIFPKEDLTPDSLIGKTKAILYSGNETTWGLVCLVADEYNSKEYIGKNAILRDLKKNTQENAKYPYIATLLEIIE